ncbi:MAG: (d)CMP kinase [Desulfobacterales bacterium]|nr:(d)CMP kinase [Desulfobacterales bacterium]MCP4160160.1 (d)CMP kinase [Deltaproteobacteria bacterium]
MTKYLVTIDGPAGAGKSTVSKNLAISLNYIYVDTGALYRGVAYYTILNNIDYTDTNNLKIQLDKMDLRFKNIDGDLKLFLNGSDISSKIRTPEISMQASKVASIELVRSYLLDLQHKLGVEKNAVFEGRDMGTTVFPNADVKFYLDSSTKERALRRFKELTDSNQTLEDVEQDIIDRDNNDKSRKISPLKQAEDAHFIDATHMNVDEVVNKMVGIVSNISS